MVETWDSKPATVPVHKVPLSAYWADRHLGPSTREQASKEGQADDAENINVHELCTRGRNSLTFKCFPSNPSWFGESVGYCWKACLPEPVSSDGTKAISTIIGPPHRWCLKRLIRSSHQGGSGRLGSHSVQANAPRCGAGARIKRAKLCSDLKCAGPSWAAHFMGVWLRG